jgi:GDP-L-fucose synthase
MNSELRSTLILGSDGILGIAIRNLLRTNDSARIEVLTHDEIDHLDPEMLAKKIHASHAEIVINAYQRQGSIATNKRIPCDLLSHTLSKDVQFIPASFSAGAKKIVNVLPNCIYPDGIPVPFDEKNLWQGYPEETVSYYALSKKILIVQGDAFRKQHGFSVIHLITTATYGPYDIFNPEDAQVIPAMILKFSKALSTKAPFVDLWGTGKATREFLYCEDAAQAIVRAASEYDEPSPLNIASGVETRLLELAQTVASLLEFTGELRWDASKPEGIRRKCLSPRRYQERLGALPALSLREGLRRTVDWFKSTGGAKP